MASFRNPNNPTQPQPGVYGWFVQVSGGLRCVYIGQSGKKPSAHDNGTLLRGVSELCRAIFASDAPDYRRLDTDFVVGTAIRFFEREVGPVFWEHLSDDPGHEDRLFLKHTPLIQRRSSPQLLPQFKVPMEEHHWRLAGATLERRMEKMREAERRVFEELKRLLPIEPLQADGAAHCGDADR